MSLSRCALLISNAGESGDEHYCKGVLVDIQNYKTFLTSPIGGWWAEDRCPSYEPRLPMRVRI